MIDPRSPPSLLPASGRSRPARRILAASLWVAVSGLAAAPAAAREDPVGPPASEPRGFSLASSDEVEKTAITQYRELIRSARSQNALAPDDNPALIRLREIAQKMIPFTAAYNARARQWQWEVNLIGSKQINAFCMPGGKIAFFTGILRTLRLTDDEVAVVMGHEIAHALREDGRDRLSQQRMGQVFTTGAAVLSAIFGYGNLGGQLADGATRLTLLKYSRDDESGADKIGLELAARAGFDPRAGVVLWQKMAAAAKGSPPQWLSTHPSNDARINDIRRELPKVMPLYAEATGRPLDALPDYPPRGAAGAGAPAADTSGRSAR